ncbi:hypothetical protein J6590_052851 [Homalodisca vitripennis]|nr:hypothetical protein J6590_052851 [Homalodisca vitripennis]
MGLSTSFKTWYMRYMKLFIYSAVPLACACRALADWLSSSGQIKLRYSGGRSPSVADNRSPTVSMKTRVTQQYRGSRKAQPL